MLKKYELIKCNSKTAKPGDQFGRLKVLAVGRTESSIRVRVYAICVCTCGTETKVRIDGLASGKTRSCGCLHKEGVHGLSQHPLYKRWANMMARCNNPNNAAYGNYGGRGISVCPRWQDAAKFIEDMEPSYKANSQIDRINNDGNYEPGNVRWTTSKVNNNNRRSNRTLTFRGRTQSIVAWSRELGLADSQVGERLKNGWTLEEALTTPRVTDGAKKMKKGITFNGETKSFSQWDRVKGWPRGTVNTRITRYGWSIEKALTTPNLGRSETMRNIQSSGARKTLELHGEVKTLDEWAVATGLSKNVIRSRLNRGWTVEHALTLPKGGASPKPEA